MDPGPTRDREPIDARRLSTFIRVRQADILAEWEATIRQLPVARDLDRPALIDHIPSLLDRIADMADELVAGDKPRLPADLAEIHALERLDEGFDLGQVVTEFAVLRDCIVRLWSNESRITHTDALGVRALNQAIDKAVAASIQRYTYARDRTLHSLDRISAAAFETRSLDEFLERLLRVLLQTTAAVDSATILLREGDLLRVRASVGMESEVAAAFTLRIGQGFAGTIAQTKRPLHLHSAGSDPLVMSPSLRRQGVKGLFGVPLISLVNEHEVIGVAHMGSLTAHEFSIQDQRVFSAMAHRVTAAISQHMLRDDAERRARQQQAIAKLNARALVERDLQALLDDAVHTAREIVGADFASALALESDAMLQVKAESGWGPDIGPLRLPADERWLDGFALETAVPVVIDDLPNETRFESPPMYRERGVRSAISVPIPLPGADHSYGVLGVHSRRRSAFSADHVAFLQTCAHVLGTAIALHRSEDERARLLRQEQAARVEAERTLAVLDTVLAASSVGIGFLDTELRYVRINEALAAINGRARAEHIGRTVREVVGDRPADLLEPMLRRLMETREPVANFEFTGAPPSSPETIRSFLANYVPVQTPHDELIGVGAVVIEITERRRAEDSLRERELQLQTLADNIPQLAWMADETGKAFWVNQRWHEFSGLSLEEVREDPSRIHHPDYIARVRARYEERIASGLPWQDVFPMRGKDGAYRWFLARAVPIRDEGGKITRWFGTNTDVTEQRLMTDATAVLTASLDYRETLGRIAELAVPALGDWCAVDLVEGQGVTRVAVTHADPAKVQMAHDLARRYPPDWDAPHGVAAVIRTGKPELVPEIPDEALVSRARDAEHLELARSLGLRSLVSVPLVARGRILGAISLISAESGRRYTEADVELAQELGRRAGLAVDNARLYQESQRETKMREDILATVSHDLKNPLAAILLAATMLLEQPDPLSRKHLETIHRASTRMDHLIADLLDMASVQAGRLSLDRTPTDADELTREAIELHAPIAIEKGVALVRGPDLTGCTLLCDRERVLQVLGNLLGNAIKFCAAGDRITLHGRREDKHARFAVQDTGPGIPEGELAHIFEPYWSGEGHAKKGTGLGLFISKGIVEAHPGQIWVESTVGEGTTFYFTLPVA